MSLIHWQRVVDPEPKNTVRRKTIALQEREELFSKATMVSMRSGINARPGMVKNH